VRITILSLCVLTGGIAACASGPRPAPKPAAEAPPPRPPRRIGLGTKPGQVELESAIAAAKAGKLDLAAKRANDAIEKNPNLEHAYLLLGSACAMKDDSACERAAYERGIEALPRSAPLKRELGLWFLQNGKYDEAIQRYEQANTLAGGKAPEYMADLAYAYVFAGKVAKAKSLATDALKLDAGCFTCAMSLGQANLSLREYPDAVEAYKTAAALDRASPDAKHGLAKSYFLAGQLADASGIYEALVSQQPEDHRLRVQAAQVQMAMKKYKAAAAHLQVVADANPGQKALLERLLEAQTKAKDKKGAASTKKRIRDLGGQ